MVLWWWAHSGGGVWDGGGGGGGPKVPAPMLSGSQDETRQPSDTRDPRYEQGNYQLTSFQALAAC